VCAFASGRDLFLEGFVNLASRFSGPTVARSWFGEPGGFVSYLRRIDASDNHHRTPCANPVQVVVGLVPRDFLHFRLSQLTDATSMNSLNQHLQPARYDLFVSGWTPLARAAEVRR
jgi:hypothetical protein